MKALSYRSASRARPAAIEHRVISQADPGLIPITSARAAEQNTTLETTGSWCARNNKAAATFAAGNHEPFSVGHGEAGAPVGRLLVGRDRAAQRVTTPSSSSSRNTIMAR